MERRAGDGAPGDASDQARAAVSRDLKSCVYRGWVRHRRRAPKSHTFRYPIFLLYLDLTELERAFSGRWLWSIERRNVASFRREDYFGPKGVPLDVAVRDRVQQEIGHRPTGPIRILTHLRYFGYCFNPVTFYYCFDEDGETLRATLAEITNTPWGERHTYALPATDSSPTIRARFPKRFHVSPFFEMDHEYDWRFTTPGEQLAVHMQNHARGELLFDATLKLDRRPLTGWELAKALCRHPFVTGSVLLAIYWQAARLWLKRIPFITHPSKRLPATAEAAPQGGRP
ncbi:MAG: DUF1365 domain-containing protein [Planctomycetota bacterium]